MQFLSLQDKVDDLLRGVFAFLCQFIYSIIAWLYDLFMTISKARMLSDDGMQGIYQRVTIILTIVMIFYVTFEVVKYVIDPATFSDKEKGAGKLIYKMLAVVILIAFVPTIFSLGYKFQNVILENQIISQVIMGHKNVRAEEIGKDFAANTLSMFYYAETAIQEGTTDRIFSDTELHEAANCDGVPCGRIVNINIDTLRKQGDVPLLSMGLDARAKKGTINYYYIHFDGLLATAVGVFIAYMLILYCIDAGVRVAQLTFLQIIAPIPIIGYLSPKKDGIFEKWAKQCFTTYIDLFLRMAIIHFVLLICQTLTSSYSESLKNITGNQFMNVLVYIALIMGLLLFAQKAPKLLGELFPKMGAASGEFGLSGKNRGMPQLKRVVGGAVGGAAGAIAGAATGAIQGWRRSKSLNKDGEAKGVGAGIWGATKGIVRGATGGTARGIYNGAKKGSIIKNTAAGIKNQKQANQRFGNREENGYTLGHQIEDRARNIFGMNSRVDSKEKEKAPLERKIKEHEAEEKYRKTISDKAFENAVVKGKGSSDARVNRAVNKYNQLQQREKDLEDANSSLSQEYQVGKVKHDSNSRKKYNERLTAKNNAINNIDVNQIKNNISDDSLGLDRSQFKKQKVEKEYDQAAHEAAKHRYMKTSVMGSDGIPVQEIDMEAWERDKDKFTKDKITEEFDQRAYDVALEKAKTQKAEQIKQTHIAKIEQRFNQDVADCVYSSQNEADAARAAEQQDISRNKKKAKDEVSFAYEDWALQGPADAANDQELYDLTQARIAENKIYNDDSSSGNQVNREDDIKDTMYEIAEAQLIESILASGGDPSTITADDIRHEAETNVSRAQAEDEWVKKKATKSKNESVAAVRDITAQQERIKHETEGSGINEGKK